MPAVSTRLLTAAVLWCVLAASGCAQQEGDRVYGSFIVVIEGAGKDTGQAREIITTSFSRWGVTSVSYLSKDTFVMNLREDPGLEVVTAAGRKNPAITRIEANWRYRIPPQPAPQLELPAR